MFFVFRDSNVLYLYVMNILCTFHIFMYGYVTPSSHWKSLISFYLCIFQTTYRVKQCITCQGTNYHYTANISWYILRLELLRSRDIRAINERLPKYCKNFSQFSICKLFLAEIMILILLNVHIVFLFSNNRIKITEDTCFFNILAWLIALQIFFNLHFVQFFCQIWLLFQTYFS